MNLKKRFAYAGMAAALALSLTMPTFAAVTGVTDVNPAPFKAGGKGGDTIISVFETETHTGNLSVEVPLYLTLAVVKDPAATEPTLVTPKNYHIKNTSKAADGVTKATYAVAVAQVSIDSLQQNGWTLGAYTGTQGADNWGAGTNNEKKMALGFVVDKEYEADAGGTTWTEIDATTSYFYFPELAAEKSKSVECKTYQNATMFYAGGKFKPIPPEKALAIDVVGAVSSGYTLTNADQAAVPQFRVTYTVVALDKNGDPIGSAYAGNVYGPYPHDGLLDQDADQNYNSNFDKDSNPKVNP